MVPSMRERGAKSWGKASFVLGFELGYLPLHFDSCNDPGYSEEPLKSSFTWGALDELVKSVRLQGCTQFLQVPHTPTPSQAPKATRVSIYIV
jgi:hypothetical protein